MRRNGAVEIGTIAAIAKDFNHATESEKLLELKTLHKKWQNVLRPDTFKAAVAEAVPVPEMGIRFQKHAIVL